MVEGEGQARGWGEVGVGEGPGASVRMHVRARGAGSCSGMGNGRGQGDGLFEADRVCTWLSGTPERQEHSATTFGARIFIVCANTSLAFSAFLQARSAPRCIHARMCCGALRCVLSWMRACHL